MRGAVEQEEPEALVLQRQVRHGDIATRETRKEPLVVVVLVGHVLRSSSHPAELSPAQLCKTQR